MDWDDRAESTHRRECEKWFKSFIQCRDAIAVWVSSFRNDSPCELEDYRFGSFNWCCVFRFQDGVRWMARFAVAGKAMDRDRKLRQEVATMRLLKEKTTIPVPKIHACGPSEDNQLGLGPFIIMDYVDGRPLGKLWEDPNEDRVLRRDINEEDLRKVFRQISGYFLELAQLQFSGIGSLAITKDGNPWVERAPLTLKMQEIEAHGGVKVGGRKNPFSSCTEYFDYVVDQDFQHLKEQPNSVDDTEDARKKYIFRKLVQAAVPLFVSKDHDRSPSRLLNDDFRFGNILVKSQTDLTIVAVLDWEWAYAAPYQMFYSPPRWLLMKKPIYWDDFELSRYRQLLTIFLEEMEGEETQLEKQDRCQKPEKLSRLMRNSIDDGKFWFHELIYACFENASNSAWVALCKLRPEIEQVDGISESEVLDFVKRKEEQLAAYKIEILALVQ